MSFQQALSGLSASSKALDVVSNNVANSSTVGFKAAEAHFADVFAASLQGGTAFQPGVGTEMTAAAQQFTQGNITTTNNPLDVAINGNGFFRMSNNGVISYSRSGQFHLDKTGYFVNDQGLHLTGYVPASDGTIRPTTPSELQITDSLLKLKPSATGASQSGLPGVQMSVNLDSRATTKTFTAESAPVPEIDPAGYNFSNAVTLYDSLGNPHTMTMYFAKTDVAGQWKVYGNVDGTQMDGTDDTPNLTSPIILQFDSAGQLQQVTDPAGNMTYDATQSPVVGSPEIDVSIDLSKVASNLGIADTGAASWSAGGGTSFKLNFTGSTQYGAAFATNRVQQDGYNSGNLAGISITSDGVVQGRYSNGQSRNLGQIALASFQNQNGLLNIGGDQWIQTSVSGEPTMNAPGSGQLGVLQSNSVEESNVDLTSELVKMITQQRNYQANAQSIKTQDQIMQTLLNLR